MTRRPDISIVTVNYGTADEAVTAVESAIDSAGNFMAEAIVVDNGSGENDLQTLRRDLPAATIVPLDQNQGFAVGNNAGIERAKGRYVLFLNPDTESRVDAIAKLVRYLDANPSVGVVAPKLLNPDGTLQINAYRRFPNLLTLFVEYCLPLQVALLKTRFHPHNVPKSAFAGCRPIAHAIGAALLVRSDALDAVGGFNEDYFLYLEETELQERIAAAGWPIHLFPDAEVVHSGGSTSGGLAFAAPFFIASVQTYFGQRVLPRAVMFAGSLISLVTLYLARLLRPSNSKIGRYCEAYRIALRNLLPHSLRHLARPRPTVERPDEDVLQD